MESVLFESEHSLDKYCLSSWLWSHVILPCSIGVGLWDLEDFVQQLTLCLTLSILILYHSMIYKICTYSFCSVIQISCFKSSAIKETMF